MVCEARPQQKAGNGLHQRAVAAVVTATGAVAEAKATAGHPERREELTQALLRVPAPAPMRAPMRALPWAPRLARQRARSGSAQRAAPLCAHPRARCVGRVLRTCLHNTIFSEDMEHEVVSWDGRSLTSSMHRVETFSRCVEAGIRRQACSGTKVMCKVSAGRS